MTSLDRAEQIQQIGLIISRYENFECIACAQAIKRYLVAEGIRGQHIKLNTGSSVGLDSYIYDDNVPGDAISENGRHEGIVIMISGVETVFDNHHPSGISLDEWINNLQFHAKINYNQAFQQTEEEF